VSLFGVALVVQNFRELVVPLIYRFFTNIWLRRKDKWTDSKVPQIPLSAAEEQFAMDEYNNTLEDMSEVIIQYGYVTLFVICLPITPLFALLSNIVEIKVDGVKLVRYSRRPQPNGAKGLGSWVFVLEYLSFIAAVTNVALYTMLFDHIEYFVDKESVDLNEVRLRIFLGMCLALCSLIFLLKTCISDMPISVERHLRRQGYIEDILVKGQLNNKHRLSRLDLIEKEIREREESTCCFGRFRVTPSTRYCCIPWFQLNDRSLVRQWTDPLLQVGSSPTEKTRPNDVEDYGEVLKFFEQDIEILPLEEGTERRKTFLPRRPHRATML